MKVKIQTGDHKGGTFYWSIRFLKPYGGYLVGDEIFDDWLGAQDAARRFCEKQGWECSK